MKFLTKLEEALESPDLPSKDEWEVGREEYSSENNWRIAEIFGLDWASPTRSGNVRLTKQFGDKTYGITIISHGDSAYVMGNWTGYEWFQNSNSRMIPVSFDHTGRQVMLDAVKEMFNRAERAVVGRT